MRWSEKFPIVLAGALVAILFVSGTVLAAGASGWPSAGHDLQNTRYQNTESKIKPSNAGSLTPRWVFTTGGDVSATPAVDDTAVYFPDWAGNLFALDRNTGAQIWSHQISEYTGIAGDVVRATPAIAGDKLIFGDQAGYHQGDGAYVMAVDRYTGNLIWKTQVETTIFPIVTQSAVVQGNTVYVGVASAEEAFAAFIPNYPCCAFRGSVLALDANTGQILWKTYTVPEGYSGGSVWGSTPSVDRSRGSLYVTTGNNYSAPQAVLDCVAAAGGDPGAMKACISPDDHFDSIMALDLKTGAIKWATTALPFDAWNVDCIPFFGDGSACPQPAGPDYDFGQGPALFTVHTPGSEKPRDLVGAGQKSGQYWALDADTGAVVWVTQVGPGGLNGGLQWGSATDGDRIYVSDSNSMHTPTTLLDNRTITSGFYSALDAATGQILWQTPDPAGSTTQGAVTGANGVVYACSMDTTGKMYALDAASGAILWTYASGGSCNAGAAVSNGTVFWGSGYSNFGAGTPNNKLFAFGLP
jgi:polyvinyl alcohol dehydrogenase (cytochrome)